VFPAVAEHHPLDLHAARVRCEEGVHVLQEHALAGAAPAEHDQGLARAHVERHPPQDGLVAEALLEAAAADVDLCRHVAIMKSLVRKKSDTSTVIEAATTVRVVARPTPSAPPVTASPS